jgi:protocatechuate 3,4-dioxygenase beta subunit
MWMARDEASRRRVGRRKAITVVGAASAGMVLSCGGSPTGPTDGGGTSGTGSGGTGGTGGSTNSACAVTPTETVGPFPSLTDLFRSDIREGKPGTLLTLTIRVTNVNSACSGVPNANVEIWHVDAAGNYSQYGTQTAQTYLRGIQTTNTNGEVTFTTLYPGWYQGRATHIHVEVTIGSRSVKVTQIAFPESTNDAVHTQGAYAGRGTNPLTNARDGIFADSLASELVTPIGATTNGYTANAQIVISI